MDSSSRRPRAPAPRAASTDASARRTRGTRRSPSLRQVWRRPGPGEADAARAAAPGHGEPAARTGAPRPRTAPATAGDPGTAQRHEDGHRGAVLAAGGWRGPRGGGRDGLACSAWGRPLRGGRAGTGASPGEGWPRRRPAATSVRSGRSLAQGRWLTIAVCRCAGGRGVATWRIAAAEPDPWAPDAVFLLGHRRSAREDPTSSGFATGRSPARRAPATRPPAVRSSLPWPLLLPPPRP